MSLTREPKARTKKANALTDPRPTFISLVKAGANKTPFSAVKSVSLEGQDAKDFIMSLKKHDIAKLTFKADAFKAEADVTKWLTEGGYTGFTISTKAETGEFEVIGNETLVDIRRVEVNGVIVYVGKAPDAEGETMDAETVAKAVSEGRAAAVVAVKGDEAAAAAPAADVVPEAAPEAVAEVTPKADETPAVAGDATAAETIDANAIRAEDIGAGVIPAEKLEIKGDTFLIDGGAILAGTITAKSVHVQPVAPVDVAAAALSAKAVLTKLAEAGVQVKAEKGYVSIWTVETLSSLLSSLHWLCEDQDWNGLADADVQTIKQAGASLIGVLVGAMQGLIDKHVENFTAQKAAQKSAEPSPELAAIQASLKAMQDQLTQLTAANAELSTAKDAAETARAEAEARAKAAEEARKPSRKGSDVGDSQTTAPSDKPKAQKSEADMSDAEYLEKRMRADTFGLGLSG